MVLQLEKMSNWEGYISSLYDWYDLGSVYMGEIQYWDSMYVGLRKIMIVNTTELSNFLSYVDSCENDLYMLAISS